MTGLIIMDSKFAAFLFYNGWRYVLLSSENYMEHSCP